jgi:hypothetical protein
MHDKHKGCSSDGNQFSMVYKDFHFVMLSIELKPHTFSMF